MMTEISPQNHSEVEEEEGVVDFLPAVLGAIISGAPTGEATGAEASEARVLVL